MNQFKNYPPQYLLSNPNKANGQQSQIIALSSAQQLTIGRSHENSLQILDNTISKKHSKIVYLKGNYYVYDLQSANGVLLNGEKIQNQCKLEDGDCLQFGKYPILYKFMDNTSKSKSRGKGKINLKDYLFQDNATQPNKQKNNSTGKDIFQGQQSVITQPITQSRIPTQPAFKNKKVRPKQSKIKIPDLSDYLKLTNVDNEQSEKQIKRNDKQSPQQKYTRSRMSKNGYGPKQGKIKLQSLQQEIPNGQQLKQYKLQKRERNIYIQQQQALQNLERQRRKIEQQKLKKQLQQAKLGQDLLQKQLLLQQKVRQQQQKVQKQKQKLQQQFIKRQQIKREQELLRIKNMEQKQKQMMAKIQQQRNRQIQQLKNKQKIIKQQSQNQYKKQYERRKKQLQTQAQALARQYQNIYRQTIKKVRTQIDNQQSTINKMQSKQQQLTSQSQSLTDNIKILEQQLNKTKKQFLQISGRNKACILYASELQDKIDALGRKQFTQNQQGYYKNFTSPGFNTSNKNIASKKVEESILNSRKFLKIKVKQYENILQQIASLSLTLKERQYASSDVSDFVDTIFQNLQIIQKLKQEYLELVQCQRTVQQIWDAEIEQNSELQNKNRVLQSEITKNIRQIDENSRDQIKKSTEQRLHMLKVMHFCPEQKKNAAKFLIQEMLNIQQQIHKFRMTNQDYHNKICKIISKTEKMKRQNEYFSQILFSQDQNGHHFDNMKVVINNLIDKIGQQKNIDNIGDCLQLAKESMKYQLLVQSEIQRKKGLRQNMRKISEMGLAPGQIRITDKNPLTFFGDLLTNKQIQMQKRKNTITSLQNESNNLKNEIKLLEDKKSKISQALQKYKVQQLNQARKYLGKTNGGR